jgi:MerR family transcriptional regulator, light-induced transcriptional regulator
MQTQELESVRDHPLYNIGVVTRLTGISIATLRAWERRYGFPRSTRTIGGHRLYSNRDVERLRWVKGQIEQGMQTAQAVKALLYQEAQAPLPVEYLDTVPDTEREKTSVSMICESVTKALLRHDTDQADLILAEALPVLHPEVLILDVIGPAMVAIGDAWHSRKISVASEHLATHYLRQRLLMWMVSGPPPASTRPIVLACAPNELHEGSLLMLGALLRRRRWPVIYLGQMVPLPDLAALVRDLSPALVVVVAMSEETANALADWPVWLPEAAKIGKPIFSFAGRVFSESPEWRMRVAGVFLGATLRDGLDTVERLLG